MPPKRKVGNALGDLAIAYRKHNDLHEELLDPKTTVERKEEIRKAMLIVARSNRKV